MSKYLVVACFWLIGLLSALSGSQCQTIDENEPVPQKDQEEQGFLDKIRAYLERDLNGDFCPGVTKTINNIDSLSDLIWRPDELCRQQCKEVNGEESLYQVGRYNYMGSSVKCCCELRKGTSE